MMKAGARPWIGMGDRAAEATANARGTYKDFGYWKGSFRTGGWIETP